ncbi:MAG: dihydrolipoamide succinyltransferase, partial [Candidatus Eisenbacteria bacterium]|nr:dihydrolipoamide succinyltransferase [Candidatus Eisenbacteria bacterium]
MSEIKVPRLAESISEAVLVQWLQPDGATVAMDQPIATLETDKAAVELAAPGPGVLKHARAVGETVHVDDVIGRIEAGSGAMPATPPAPPTPAAAPVPAAPVTA